MTEETKLGLQITDETQKQIDGLLDRLGSTMGGGYPADRGQIDRVVRPVETETTELKSAEGSHGPRANAGSSGAVDSGSVLRIWTVINGGLFECDFKGNVVV